jgi:osmotically-inducible protein OsmY
LGRTGDEVASWLGSDEVSRQRERGMQDDRGSGRRGYARSDDRVREDVCDRLTHDPRIDASGIAVSCYEGEVTLSGTVGRREARQRAEDCALQVAGVRNVQNDLHVHEQDTADGNAETGLTQGIELEMAVATGSGRRNVRSSPG